MGGDWYDIVALHDGRIALVVGDCVGHGLTAATVMGQLRSACRALLLQEPALRDIEGLDRFAARSRRRSAPPFLRDPGSGHRRADLFQRRSPAGDPGPCPTAPPSCSTTAAPWRWGSGADGERTEASCIVPARSTLLLYTDGLVERRRRPIDDGIAEAGTAVRGAASDTLEDLATAGHDRLAPAGGYEDDVALVIYRHPAPLDVTFPAEPAQLAPVRARCAAGCAAAASGPG